MLVEFIGLILFVVGLMALFAGAFRAPAPASGIGPAGASGDALLIGGALGIVFGVVITTVGLI